ncbi:MAG: GntR family transcriptional regulator [Burkholderiaceae bacterium]
MRPPPEMSPAARSAPTTKQRLIADALSSDIQRGKYKIGDKLPSEPELSQRFGVSRHTVRAALRSLHAMGLVYSQQGIGTMVQDTQSRSRYSHAFSSAEDLLQYAATTRVRVIDTTEVVVDQTQAPLFGCKPGEHWWRVRTVRSDPASRSIVAYSEIYIPLVFGGVLKEAATGAQPVFALIAERFGQTITEIRQRISCVAHLPADAVDYLKARPGSPGLEIVRTYVAEGGRTLEVARSLHPSDVFSYSMRMQLQVG